LSIFVADKELVNENDVFNKIILAMSNTKNLTYTKHAYPRLLCVKLALRILLLSHWLKRVAHLMCKVLTWFLQFFAQSHAETLYTKKHYSLHLQL